MPAGRTSGAGARAPVLPVAGTAEEREGEARVGDQSVDHPATEGPQHAGSLLHAGRHPRHHRDPTQIVELHREHTVVDDAPDRPPGGIEEPTAGVADRARIEKLLTLR